MPFIRIKTNTNCSSPIKIDHDSTLNAIKETIANNLGTDIADLEKTSFKIGYTKNITIDHTNQDQTLKMLGIQPLDTIEISVTLNREKYLGKQQKKEKEEAQHGLRTALQNAEKEKAQIIITVGSYLNKIHNTSSLQEQQFPIERVGASLGNGTKVHLIHIDPGFQEETHNVQQYHELPGWTKDPEHESNLVKTYHHDSGKYVITTIAVPITNKSEEIAYFGEPSPEVNSMLDIDLTKARLHAQKDGRAFITGNFYNPTTRPVINDQPSIITSPALIENVEKKGKADNILMITLGLLVFLFICTRNLMDGHGRGVIHVLYFLRSAQ